jgi:hypothetical protein
MDTRSTNTSAMERERARVRRGVLQLRAGCLTAGFLIGLAIGRPGQTPDIPAGLHGPREESSTRVHLLPWRGAGTGQLAAPRKTLLAY